MELQTNPYLVWQLIPAMITAWLGFYIKSRTRKKRESDSFAILMFAAAAWSLGNAIQWISPNTTWQIFWTAVTYIGIVIIPTAWFLVAVKFTGYFRAQVEKIENIFLVFPALIYLSIITNDFHNLFFRSFDILVIDNFTAVQSNWGVLFYIHTYYSYILVFLGILLLSIGLFANRRSYGIYISGLLIGVLAPLVGNVLFLIGYLPPGFPDPTPITFAVTGVAFAWAIFWGGMLNVVPTAHETIIANLANGVLVLDLDNNILDINPAALDILKLPKTKHLDRPLTEFLEDDPKLVESIQEGLNNLSDGETNITISPQDQTNIYNLLISEIQDVDGRTNGKLLQFSNITERQKVQVELEETIKSHHSILDTIHDSYFESDPKGIVTYVNTEFVNKFADINEGVVGKHFRHFVHRKSVRDIFERYKIIYSTGEAQQETEYYFAGKNGEEFIGEVTSSPIMAGDKVVGTRSLVRDITARVKAEKEIAEQKDLLDGLLQQSPIAMVINDLDSKITLANPAFVKLFGYSQEEILGMDLDDILSTPNIVNEMKGLSALGMSEQVSVIGQRKRKDGSLLDVEMFAAPMIVRGEKSGYLVFYNDISERLKVEADLEKSQSTYFTVLDTLQDNYFEADTSGVITYCNAAFIKANGAKTRADIVGKNFRHVVARRNIRDIYEKFGELYKTKKPVGPFEYYFKKKDGSMGVANMVVSPIFDEGEVVGTRGIVHDVSIWVKAEEVLRQAKEAAEHRASELATINRISEVVSRSLDLTDILQTVCVELTTIFKVRNVGVGLLNKEEDSLEIIAFYTIDPDEESVKGIVLPLERNLYSKEALKTLKTMVIQNAKDDPRIKNIRDLKLADEINAIMILPLVVRGKAIGTIGMPAIDPTHIFSENEIELAETIASQIAAAIDNGQLYAKTETALDIAERDLEIGRQIQSDFFPEKLPEISGWDIATHFHAARQVAGDFYDVFQFRNSNFTAFIIADVCDKGVGAALFMVLFRSLLRAFSETKVNISNVKAQLLKIILNTNNFIAEFHGRSNMFATLFFGILDPDKGVLYYVNGGHDPPVILDKEGVIIQRLMPTGPAVGMFPDMIFNVEQIQFNKGDFLVGFTDGATDAKNSAGELFSEDHLLEEIRIPRTSMFSMLYELGIRLQNYIGGQDQFDDITLIAIKRKLNKKTSQHEISRSAHLNFLGELRDFSEACAKHCGLSSEDAFAFKLVTEEICTNIIQYGFEGREPGTISLAFECDKNKARLKINEDGMYFSPYQATKPDLAADWEEREIGGLGIHFVKELMDNVFYNKTADNRNQLILEKVLKTSKRKKE